MRVLAVDLGLKRIGIAVGAQGLAQARPNLNASGSLKRDAEAIANLARAEDADWVAVGIPYYETDEGESKQTKACEMLATVLEGLGLRVARVDESLSSVVAHDHLAELGLKYAQRKKRIDGAAACTIIDRFFLEFNLED